MNQKLRKGMAVLALGTCAILAVQSLERSWQNETHPKIQTTTFEKRIVMEDGTSILYDGTHLRSIDGTIRSRNGKESMEVHLTFRGSAPAIVHLPLTSLGEGPFEFTGTGTLQTPGGAATRTPLSTPWVTPRDGILVLPLGE